MIYSERVEHLEQDLESSKQTLQSLYDLQATLNKRSVDIKLSQNVASLKVGLCFVIALAFLFILTLVVCMNNLESGGTLYLVYGGCFVLYLAFHFCIFKATPVPNVENELLSVDNCIASVLKNITFIESMIQQQKHIEDKEMDGYQP